ncbi:MAG TPA: DUF4823 domain-containing protein [Terriglobales bacterium]|nr:DUF4823 domain-containing protein [Terriglobales bacterium]
MLILSGCVSKYRVDAYTPPAAHIEKEASFYVPLPQNGQFDGTEYPNSGSQTAAELRAALLVHVSKVEVGTTKAEDLTAALAEAKKRGLDHLAQADILHWEDRATEWSGIPDKITLKLSIYDVQSGALLSSTVTAASSKWGTLGGDHPQDLLPEPIKRFVDPLF